MMEPRYQHTVAQPISIEGIGVHSGQPCMIECHPAPSNYGISFEKRGEASTKQFLNDMLTTQDETNPAQRRTIIGVNQAVYETVEHFMAALWTLGISNLRIIAQGQEFPILDGSAKDYIQLLKKTGVTSQDDLRPIVHIEEPLFVSANLSAILVLPHDRFRISYTLDYLNTSLRAQVLSEDIDPDYFEKEIAPARTFCLEGEAQALLQQGLGKGANYENTLVIGPHGPIKNMYRFADECARHKVLDLVGDLALLNADMQAHVIAVRSGHQLNNQIRNLIANQRRTTHVSVN